MSAKHEGDAFAPEASQERRSVKGGIEHAIEGFVFASRWIQAPLYLGLILGELVYAYKFVHELYELLVHVPVLTEEDVMLTVLSLVDVTMVANLVAMVVIGGYATFVSKLDVDAHEDRPDWLAHIDAATMKIKLAASLVGISSIHLLKAFIDISEQDPQRVWLQIAIHLTFLFSALILATAERVQHGPPQHGHGGAHG